MMLESKKPFRIFRYVIDDANTTMSELAQKIDLNRIKYLVLFLFLLGLAYLGACDYPYHQDGNGFKEVVKPLNEKRNLDKRDSLLLGDWGIYEQRIKGLPMLCNACPRIQFYHDHTAILVDVGGSERCYFSWSYQNDSLTLTPFEVDTTSFYFISKGGDYPVLINMQEEFLELTLQQSEFIEYILRRGYKIHEKALLVPLH